MGAIVNEKLSTKNRTGVAVNFDGVNNDTVLIASTSCQDPQGSMFTKLTDQDMTLTPFLPDNSRFWDANPGDLIRKCIKTCALSTSLPQYPVGSNGNTTFSPQRWDFAISRSQNNTNNIINPTITEGDRRFVFRYHSGRGKDRSGSGVGVGGFDNIIFEYKEWIWTAAWPHGPSPPGNTSNWFASGVGGWMEVDGYDLFGIPQTPESPVDPSQCKLCYAYNKAGQSLGSSAPIGTTWQGAYTPPPPNGNAVGLLQMESLYEVTHGVCLGGEPNYLPGSLVDIPLYIEACSLPTPPSTGMIMGFAREIPAIIPSFPDNPFPENPLINPETVSLRLRNVSEIFNDDVDFNARFDPTVEGFESGPLYKPPQFVTVGDPRYGYDRCGSVKTNPTPQDNIVYNVQLVSENPLVPPVFTIGTLRFNQTIGPGGTPTAVTVEFVPVPIPQNDYGITLCESNTGTIQEYTSKSGCGELLMNIKVNWQYKRSKLIPIDENIGENVQITDVDNTTQIVSVSFNALKIYRGKTR